MIRLLPNFLSFLLGFLFTNLYHYSYQLHLEQTHSENMTSLTSNYLSPPFNSTVGDVSKLLNNDHPASVVADTMANAALAVSSSVPNDAQGIFSRQYEESNCGVCGAFIDRNLLHSHDVKVKNQKLIKSLLLLFIC